MLESLFSLYSNICLSWDCSTSITFVNACWHDEDHKQHQVPSLYFSRSEIQIPQRAFVSLVSLSTLILPKNSLDSTGTELTDHKQSIMIFWVNYILDKSNIQSVIPDFPRSVSFTLQRQVQMLSQPYFMEIFCFSISDKALLEFLKNFKFINL